MGEERYIKPAVQRALGRPGRSLKDNIEIDLQEVELGGGVYWIDLT